MTTPSFFGQSGISIHVNAPLANPIGATDINMTKKITGYGHEINAWLGFYAASFTANVTQNEAEDWLNNGLGRDVNVYNSALALSWQGFVNQVNINVGPLSATRGPLMDIGNASSVLYSRILDDTVNPPVIGSGWTTIITTHTASQARYGWIEKVLNGGTCTQDDAERYRDTWLQENAWPQTSQQVSPGGGRDTGITVECLGYWAWLQAYQYEDTTTGTVTLSTKIESVLGADPNGFISIDYGRINTNAYLTPAWVAQSPLALDVIQAIVALGDVNDDRWLFGIYDDRKAHYNVMPTAIAYQHALSDPAQRILRGGTWVKPWDVRPAQWLFLTDFMATAPPVVDLRTDPRYQFIESVKFGAPWGLELNGIKIGNLAQVLAKRGLGGAQ